MPDWQKLVADRLARLDLDTAEREEVCAELAAHLEDSYQAHRTSGMTEARAVQNTLQQVTNWRDLQQQIAIEKNGGSSMRERLRQLWIPGLVSFALSTTILFALQRSPLRHYVFGGIGLSVPWLLSLPGLGALTAWLSARAGASRRTVLLATLFPALAMGFGWVSMFPIGFFLERVTGQPVSFRTVATFFLTAPVGSLLVPALALLAGAAPVRAFSSPTSSPREKAVS